MKVTFGTCAAKDPVRGKQLCANCLRRNVKEHLTVELRYCTHQVLGEYQDVCKFRTLLLPNQAIMVYHTTPLPGYQTGIYLWTFNNRVLTEYVLR